VIPKKVPVLPFYSLREGLVTQERGWKKGKEERKTKEKEGSLGAVLLPFPHRWALMVL
jgi:hypothetical protein